MSVAVGGKYLLIVQLYVSGEESSEDTESQTDDSGTARTRRNIRGAVPRRRATVPISMTMFQRES